MGCKPRAAARIGRGAALSTGRVPHAALAAARAATVSGSGSNGRGIGPRDRTAAHQGHRGARAPRLAREHSWARGSRQAPFPGRPRDAEPGFGSRASRPAGGAYPTGLSGSAVAPCQNVSIEIHSARVDHSANRNLRPVVGRVARSAGQGPHHCSDADGEA